MRSKCLTHYRRVALEEKYNNPADFHYFKNKPEFNRFFADYVRRGWLWVRECTFEDFKAFLAQYKSVIVKPMDGKQGDGIRKLNYDNQDDTALRALFDSLVDENVIVEELIVQHRDMVFAN
jgi:glutathione synthase/RimK-type ligase-like ATP-grasp enzyme